LLSILVLALALTQGACSVRATVTPPSQLYRALDTRTWVSVLNNSSASYCDITDSVGGVIARVEQGQKASFPLGVLRGREELMAQCYTVTDGTAVYVGYDEESVSVGSRPRPVNWVIDRIRVIGR